MPGPLLRAIYVTFTKQTQYGWLDEFKSSCEIKDCNQELTDLYRINCTIHDVDINCMFCNCYPSGCKEAYTSASCVEHCSILLSFIADLSVRPLLLPKETEFRFLELTEQWSKVTSGPCNSLLEVHPSPPGITRFSSAYVTH